VPDDIGAQVTAPFESPNKSIFEGQQVTDELPTKIVAAIPAFQISPNEHFDAETDRELKKLKQKRVKLINSSNSSKERIIPSTSVGVANSTKDTVEAVANTSVLTANNTHPLRTSDSAKKKQSKLISTELVQLDNVLSEWGGDDTIMNTHVQPQRKKAKQKESNQRSK